MNRLRAWCLVRGNLAVAALSCMALTAGLSQSRLFARDFAGNPTLNSNCEVSCNTPSIYPSTTVSSYYVEDSPSCNFTTSINKVLVSSAICTDNDEGGSMIEERWSLS
jgi:hypothetical protein